MGSPRYSFVSSDYLTVEEAREWVFCIAYFLVAPPPTRPLTPDEVDGMVVEEVTEEITEVTEEKVVEEEDDTDSDIMISNLARPDFVQAGVSSSEEEDSEDETAEIEDETPIIEDLPPVKPAPTPARDHRTETSAQPD